MSVILRLVLIALLLPATASAADPYVPEQLRDWQEWVLDGKEYRECPFYFDRAAAQRGDFVCAWPGQLNLSVNSDSGRFTQSWTVYAEEQWLPLPGDTAYWPHRVTANGRSVEVVLHNNVPSVYLAPGAHAIAGSFDWDERPGVLRLPAQSGLISLQLNGRPIARPERNRAGVFLGEREQQTQTRNSIKTDVYRLVSDNVPTRLTTQLNIDVSGSVREELFGPLLPDGFVPLTINSQLPARLEPDGKLRVQVRPGRWQIELRARGAEVLNAIAMPEPDSNLPATEIWSYRSADELRVTAAEGLTPADPLQMQVPDQWQQLPAFRIAPGESLNLVERSRGTVATDNELMLSRIMWLDFDGSGFIVSDEISGSMRTDWRLDMSTPFALLSASANDASILVTNGQDDGQTGVELRSRDVDVASIGRTETRGEMPVTGWDARFARTATRLNLPPGHKLLAAPGVDRAHGSWVGQWQLLDFFLVLIITIAAWRLFGRGAGIIALLALALSFHELNAPAWLWLNLLIAMALLRVAPAGRLRQTVRMYQAVSGGLLVLALIPFIASQLRVAIYPQLESQSGAWQTARVMDAFELQGPALAPARGVASNLRLEEDAREGERLELEQRERMFRKSMPAASVDEIVVSGSNLAGAYSYSRYAPNAIVQAGPGRPSWQWNSYALTWAGPVDAEQTMRLMILPRWLVTLLRFAEVLLLLLFMAVLAAEVTQRRIALPGGFRFGSAQASTLLTVAALSVLMSLPQPAQAETPNPELLRDLEKRLMQPPDCAPRCAEIVAADVVVNADSVRMNLTIHALADVAVPLPGSDQGWRPSAILVDGSAASQVVRGQNQVLWVRLSAGRHSVVLSGSAPAVDSLEIRFPTPPRVIEAQGDGWFIAGVKDRRLLSGSLQLTRMQSEKSGDTTQRWESSRFPPFVRIERTVVLDLDWHMVTTVTRIAPTQGALTLDIPLVDGETVVTANYTVTDGKILISMPPNQSVVTWRSNLPRTSPLVLNAEAGAAWQEIWGVGVGSIWHAEFSGVPESEENSVVDDSRSARFYPRGGESLSIAATRPEASKGSTLAFDSVELNVELGSRSSTATLLLEYRSTRGAQHVIRLPEGAEITHVHIDGDLEPLRAVDGDLTVPILPGVHDISVTWQDSAEVGMQTVTPSVDIGADASNISQSVNLPANRWILATSGPRLGPAVLYWSELAVLLLIAVILGRIGLAPLKTAHWLLLGLGFSTFSWPVLAMVILWLLACGARERWDTDAPWWRFNAVQILLAGLTIFALMSIVYSLPSGLLGTPDMNITGNDSHGNTLNWFADRSNSLLPSAAAWSVPMWVYKALILAWALWLSFALLRWLPWVWRCFSSQGYWRPRKAMVAAASQGQE